MEQSHRELRRGHYLGEISALCLLSLPPHLSSSPFLLAGTGSQILVYDLVDRKVTKSFEVFQGIRVHGISLDPGHEQLADSNISFRIAIFGERSVRIFKLQIGSDNPRQPFLNTQLDFVHSLPKFGHWVLDVCFLKDSATSSSETSYLAIGCSDNSLHLWDILRVNILSEVECSERCLLFSMRMIGNEIESLLIASGTIFNEIIVWKVVCKKYATIHGDSAEELVQINEDSLLHGVEYEDYLITRLIGHEGSIFRIAWFSNGSKLVSVSDDRSARIWEIHAEKGPLGFISDCSVQNGANQSGGLVLFGHNARIWDCCIFDSFIITAGEDCTCRVWDHDGRELNVIKEHTGRGVWRCLYEPSSSILITAGFDSAIKVRHLYESHKGSDATMVTEDFSAGKKLLALSTPRSSGHAGLTDSKSEYVRCLHFSREDSLYVATNNGYLYHACLCNDRAVKWTELVRIREEAPIICMDLLSNCSDLSDGFEDWVAVGDGKGTMTVVLVVGCVSGPNVELTFSWSAEEERHLLGIFWCRSAKNRFIFTTNHGGRLKLWSIYQKMPFPILNGARSYDVCLFAEFVSCFGLRIMCVDVSFDEKVLVCGDIRGNLLLFSLPRRELSGHSAAADIDISPVNYFKGAHGVSSVCSVSVAGFCYDQVEIRSTGADGCICYLKHDKHLLNLEFLGMKQVKELSVIRAAEQFDDSTFGNYAIGFVSAKFVIWNLAAETKVVQITCGGWRRPYSFFLGDVPEMKNCFSFVKDDTIYVHRHWIPENCRKLYPRNLHIQFHGREIHSLCFISSSSWIATGCEDGTVRLTRYEPDTRTWSVSKLLGEHVGGSAVRSIACVSESFMFIPDGVCENTEAFEDQENIFILISVGAKRVITAWKQTTGMSKIPFDTQSSESNKIVGNNFTSSFTAETPSLSFQWLSTDMPLKLSTYGKIQNTKKVHGTAENLSLMTVGIISGESLSSKYRKTDLNLEDNHENDWRYLGASAFLVKDARSRISVCFVVVACSDATVTLRALVMPIQRWFVVALLSPLPSPVLALQHVVIPKLPPSKASNFSGNMLFGSLYLAICGSTDGSISFWDLTESVENFMLRISSLQTESYMELQKRPRTGRGSQGGRWWRSMYTPNNFKKISGEPNVLRKQSSPGLFSLQPQEPEMQSHVCGASEISLSEQTKPRVSPQVREQASEQKKNESIPETTILAAAHVLNNVHQSGVNCLHVSDVKHLQLSDSRFCFYVVSGGDDQAVNLFKCDLERNYSQNSETITAKLDCVLPTILSNYTNRCRILNHQMKVFCLDKIISAHSSAVKGVWTDGSWVFSTSVDQRVRCWKLDQGRLIEFAHLIISVPEPEAMDVNTCGRNHYQITVAGRGMQMVEFYAENEV
ncbi:uncharacterized protein LOC142556499 isoform X1 [Primulina tabacum]|uniref:uncharacterized protein LOC142556499 isoform X1 n=2 Tax=Primulina tabacum TaxID=48773 RepID=UPI003F5A60AC